MEPLELYASLQPLVNQDIRSVVNEMMMEDQYSVSDTQSHTHNGADSVQFPTANLLDASSYLAIQKKTLSTAQVLALNTTPITLVPAPVSGSFAVSGRVLNIFSVVTGIAAFLNYAGTAYTGVNALEFRYTGAAGAKVTADISTTFLNSAATAYSWVAGVVTELVPVSNAPIVVRVPTANPATGTSPITFTVFYRVVSF